MGEFGGSQPVGAGESKPKVYRAASLKLLRAQQRGVGQQPQAHTRLAKAGVRNCFAEVASSSSSAAPPLSRELGALERGHGGALGRPGEA